MVMSDPTISTTKTPPFLDSAPGSQAPCSGSVRIGSGPMICSLLVTYLLSIDVPPCWECPRLAPPRNVSTTAEQPFNSGNGSEPIPLQPSETVTKSTDSLSMCLELSKQRVLVSVREYLRSTRSGSKGTVLEYEVTVRLKDSTPEARSRS